MGTFIGKVKKVGAYPLKEPIVHKEYGTATHRLSLETDEGWINFGLSKMDEFKIKDDNGNWVILGAGSEVVIKYTEDQHGKKANRDNLIVTNLVLGEAYVGNTTQSSRNPKPSSGVNPAERGQIMNLAVQEFGSVDNAIGGVDSTWLEGFYGLQSMVDDLMTQPKETAAPVPTPAAPAVSVADFDDDIPF